MFLTIPNYAAARFLFCTGLQNNPPDQLPREDNASRHCIEMLTPYSQENGGPLKIEHITYVEGRGNLIITYPGKTDKTVGFVGSHLDVVPADPETWDFNPFELTVDGDKLLGRGTTDCLGHIALVTEFFLQLAQAKPDLDVTVCAVFIASEEAASVPKDAGVEGLVEHGRIAHLKNGPIIWVDCADSQPCIGTAGAMQWHLEVTGKLFHSGLPHKGINSLELGMEAVAALQKRFYETYPAHPKETEYNFATPSTMKPTQFECSRNSLNQIPPRCKISGDIRLTPFYDVPQVKAAVEGWVDELNQDISQLATRGPCSKYKLPEDAGGDVGKVELTWGEHMLAGIACKLDSPGFHALKDATQEVKGNAVPYSICGSLPLVREMQQEGFDIQLTGYGLSSTYHAVNEYAKLTDMQDAIKILARVAHKINAGVKEGSA